MELYGWDELRSEGIEELERIASSKFFAGKDELIYIFKKYIELYKTKADLRYQIRGIIFYPDIAKKNEKAARDKTSNQIKKLRQLLEDFYNSDEGKESAYRIYFISDERDYRLGIKRRDVKEMSKKKMKGSTMHMTEDALVMIKEKALDFAKIYGEAVAMPKNLVARAKASGTFNWDTLGIFLISTVLVVMTSRYYFSGYRAYIEMANIHPVFVGFLVDKLAKIQKPLDNILSFELLFIIFRFIILTTIIPWVIYKKIFRANVTIYEIVNFQFYFIMCWVPFFAWIGFHGVWLLFHNSDITSLGFFTVLLFSWVLGLYYYGLYKLSGFRWKRSIPSFIIYLPVHFWFIKTL